MAAKTYSPNNGMSIVGLLFLLIPIFILMLWISTFSANPSASQEEKVKIFSSYFPTFLRSTSSISLIVLASAVGALVFTVAGRKSANRIFKVVGIIVIIVASLVLLLQLFSML
jgi:hypothetical protein